MGYIFIIVALINIILGFLVLAKKRDTTIGKLYFIFALFSGYWVFTNFLIGIIPSIFWLRHVYAIGALFVPSSVVWGVYLADNKINKYLFTSIWVYGISLALVAQFTSLIVISYESIFFGGGEFNFGILFPVYAISLSLLVAFLIYKLIYALTHTTGLKKLQLRYAMIGVFLWGATASIVSLLLPLFGIKVLIPLDSTTSIFFVGFTSYAIVKYRLMDIRVIIKRSTVFAGLVALITALYSLVSLVIAKIFGFSTLGTGITMAVIVALLFDPLKTWLSKITDAVFFKEGYKPAEFLNMLGISINSTLSLKKIYSVINLEFEKAFHPMKLAVVVTDDDKNYSITYSDGFSAKEEAHYLVTSKSAIVAYLKKHKEPIVYEELEARFQHNGEHQKLRHYLEKLHNNDIGLYVPLHVEKKLVGFLMIGNKKSGDVYNDQDITVLDAASAQIATAIENARITEHLEELVRVRTQVLEDLSSINNHQQRTPLTIIKGGIDMIEHSKMTSAEREKIIHNMKMSVERMLHTLTEFSIGFSPKPKEIAVNPEKINLAEYIKIVYGEHRELEVSRQRRDPNYKKLELIYKASEKVFPPVWADPDNVLHVASNLLDNAVLYTDKGSITVSYSVDKNFIAVHFSDTGIGVSEKEKTLIFKKSKRSERAKKRYIFGSGLGLFLAQQIAEQNGGSLTVKSDGEGKGSTFTLKLPIYKEGKHKKR